MLNEMREKLERALDDGGSAAQFSTDYDGFKILQSAISEVLAMMEGVEVVDKCSASLDESDSPSVWKVYLDNGYGALCSDMLPATLLIRKEAQNHG